MLSTILVHSTTQTKSKKSICILFNTRIRFNWNDQRLAALTTETFGFIAQRRITLTRVTENILI